MLDTGADQRARSRSSQPLRDIRWADAIADVAGPAAIHFQRETSHWLDAIRRLAHQTGVLPARIDSGTANSVKFDYFDQLRSPLLIQGATALGVLDQIDRVLQRYPALETQFSDVPQSSCFQKLFAESKGQALVNEDERLSEANSWRSWLRHRAFEFKRIMQRNVGVYRSVARGDRPVLLAVPRLDGQVSDMLPVVNVLREKHNISTVFAIVDNRLAVRIHGAGYPCMGLYKRTLGETRGINRLANGLLGQALSFLDIQCAEQGNNEVQVRALVAETADVLRRELRDAVHLNVSCQRILRELRPDAVLVGNPYTVEGRVSATVARQLGVKTATLEHGTIFADSPMWYQCPVDAVYAWGEPSRRALLSNGVSAEQMRVTGAPRYDAVFQRKQSGRKDGQFILVATSGAGDQVNLHQHQAFIRMLYQAADQTPEIQWVVKLHPKDREELYAGGNNPLHPRVRITRAEIGPQGLGIFGYLEHARALVTVSSSSALDSMAVGVPVIAVDVWSEGQQPKGIEFLQGGCTRRVRTCDELAAEARKAWQGIHDAATQAAAQAYAEQHFVNRGRAAEAVAGELAELIGRK